MAATKAITQAVVASAKPRSAPYDIRCGSLKGFLLRVERSGRRTYYVEYGRGKRHRIGDAAKITLTAARSKAKQVLGDVESGIDPRAERLRAQAQTFSEYIENVYAPWFKASRKTGERTIHGLLKRFPTFQDKPLDQITPKLVEEWRRDRLQRVGPATSNRDLNDLRAALSRAVEWELIAENPLGKVKRLRVDEAGSVRFLSPDEERRLRTALRDRDDRLKASRARGNAWRRERGYELLPDLHEQAFVDHLQPAVLLTMNTGMRWGELASLRWADVNTDLALLTVRGITAKSDRTRHIPLNAEALDVLSKWHSPRDGYVFPSRDGCKLDNMRKAWWGVLRAAGISDCRWHDLRHHFASRLAMSGVDLPVIRELLGHSDFALTLRYAHLSPGHRAAAVARLMEERP